MSSPFRRTEFKRLQAEWYDLLKDCGFEDIEDVSTEERLLKSWHNNKYQGIDPVRMDCTRQYYASASELLNTYKFKMRHHKKIWKLHAQGLTVREIADRIKTHNKSMVHRIIQQIAREGMNVEREGHC